MTVEPLTADANEPRPKSGLVVCQQYVGRRSGKNAGAPFR